MSQNPDDDAYFDSVDMGEPEDYAPSQDGIQMLISRQRAVERTAAALARSGPLQAAGISLDEDGATIGSSLTVGGDLTTTGSTDIDGTLTVDAAATFGGTLHVTGDAVFSGNLAVPNGSITNDALQNPILPEPLSGSASGFGTAASTWETKASATLTTPAGFTRALVIANSGLTLTNTTGLSARSFIARTIINTSTGFQVRVTNLDATYIATTGSNHTALVTGLTTGATFIVGTQSFTNAAWTGDPNNQAGINGVVLWLR